MSTAKDPKTWTERELTQAWRELLAAWREEVAVGWPSVLKMVVAEQFQDATERMLTADVTTEKGRAAYSEAKGERVVLAQLALPGFGLEDRLLSMIEKCTR